MADSSGAKRAVIVGLVGIGCYPVSWLGAVLGLRAFLAEREAGPRRTLAIVAMLMPGLLLPVVALESAVFRAPVQAWWAGRVQAECLEQLPKLWAAEQKFLERNGVYSQNVEGLDFKPPAGHRYTYTIGANAWTADGERVWKGHLADADRFGMRDSAGKTFKVGCITRVGRWVDAWTVSNDDRYLSDGGLLASGKPYLEFSGALEPSDGGT